MSIPKLPDVGILQYGPVVFDVLKHTKMGAEFTKDSSKRTVKYVTYTLSVEGVVTIPDGSPASSIDTQMVTLRQQLSTAGLPLRYTGRGFGSLLVNVPGGAVRDVAWGPQPEVMDFQPLGGGRSAMVKWQVKTSLPECSCPNMGRAGSIIPGPGLGHLLESTWETNLRYDEDGYATVELSGTIEIPLTWLPNGSRALSDIVDSYRLQYLNNPPTIDDFKVKDRSFKTSLDKRVMQWSYTYEEMAPMGIPAGCMKARGSYSVTPAKPFAMVKWNNRLEATYTVRKDFPRRVAYLNFVTILMDRMGAARFATEPTVANPAAAPQQSATATLPLPFRIAIGSISNLFSVNVFASWLRGTQSGPNPAAAPVDNRRAILMTFGFTEGLYEDSRQFRFEASWQLTTTFRGILKASGVWQQVTHLPRLTADNPLDTDKTVWRVLMSDLQGWRGNHQLLQTPSNDLVIDLCICDPAVADAPNYPLPPPARRQSMQPPLSKQQQVQVGT